MEAWLAGTPSSPTPQARSSPGTASAPGADSPTRTRPSSRTACALSQKLQRRPRRSPSADGSYVLVDYTWEVVLDAMEAFLDDFTARPR